MRLRLALAVLAGHGSVTAASAGTTLPVYDVDRSCAAWIRAGDASLANICVEMEQNLYDGLKVVWRDAPEYAKAYCVARDGAPAGDDGGAAAMPRLRYEALSGCLSPDRRAQIPAPVVERFRP